MVSALVMELEEERMEAERRRLEPRSETDDAKLWRFFLDGESETEWGASDSSMVGGSGVVDLWGMGVWLRDEGSLLEAALRDERSRSRRRIEGLRGRKL